MATEILKRAGISRDEFAGMVGVKPVSMRMTFQNGRFSKKAIAKLDELVGEVRERVGIEEVDELIKEVKVVEDLGDERMGTVYLVPRKPYWYAWKIPRPSGSVLIGCESEGTQGQG